MNTVNSVNIALINNLVKQKGSYKTKPYSWQFDNLMM